jgi:hypothetical protein
MYTDTKSLTLDLTLALQSLSAARALRSQNGRRTLDSDLATFYSQLVQSDVNVESIIPLLEQVTKLASDLFGMRSLPSSPNQECSSHAVAILFQCNSDTSMQEQY